MLSFLISVIASLAIVFGAPATTNAHVEAAQAPAAQQVQQAQQQAAPQDDVLMQDVWQTVDDNHVENTSDTELMLSYSRTIDASQLSSVATIRGEFALASLDFPNTYHVMRWDIVKHA